MKTLTIILILVLMCSMASALPSSTRPIAEALNWYVQDNGTDGRITTKYNRDTKEYILGYWNVPGLAEPNNAQIEIIINQYEQALIDKQAEKEANKEKIKTKLGLTDKELQELKESLEL